MASQHAAGFRPEAVRAALTSGLNRKELPEPTAQSDLETEVTKLCEENCLHREEREVLKKATIN